jgi:Glycosyl transferases group 1
MTSRRIIYVAKPDRAPSGGIGTIYRHVAILAAHGLPAFVALWRRPRVDFYGMKAPLLIFGNALMSRSRGIRRHVRHGDIWVIPSPFIHYAKDLRGTPARLVMFCQSQYDLRFTSDPSKGISEFGVDDLFVSTESELEFFREVYGVTVPFVPSYAIDPAVFFPARTKKRQIAYMPRKLPRDAEFIKAVFKRRYARYADVPWVSIDGVPQSDVARIMSESAVFLALSHKEALGLPPLEAMSCDCLAVGYHGDGGRTYMTVENGWWGEVGDWKTCVDGLAAALEIFDERGTRLDQYRSAMKDAVSRYRPKSMERELVAFWRRELERPFSPKCL